MIIPNFFNYEKKVDIFKFHLSENYNFNLNKYEKIKFNFFPKPNLEISNVQINFEDTPVTLNSKNLKIYLKFPSIYNYENFDSNKIVFNNSEIKLEISNFKFTVKKLFNHKEKILFKNLKLQVLNKDKPIVAFKEIKYANYGFNKNFIKGKVFNKKFEVDAGKELKNIDFKLVNTGISAELNFGEIQKKNLIEGVLKSKILSLPIQEFIPCPSAVCVASLN